MDDSRGVGLYYHKAMEKHKAPTNQSHEEAPQRTRSIWRTLKDKGFLQRCVLIEGREAMDEHLLLVHTDDHIRFINGVRSSHVARLVADEELSSGFAVVRPPGHHAEREDCKGFCLYNNVAVAASFLLEERARSIEKILIVDWDIHHGNGTQSSFYDDDRVLFFSVHRFGNGFYPGTKDGSHEIIGEGNGAGFNINVPWLSKDRSNADYIVVWDYVLLPVARQFKPDIVLVSAGFDAAKDDPIGDCNLTAEGFAVMLEKLREFAEGKVVLVLEGGYLPTNLSDCVLACVEVLTDSHVFNASFGRPHGETYDVIKLVRETLSPYWPVLADEVLPVEVLADQVRETLSPYWPVLADEVLPVEVLADQGHQDSFMDSDPGKARMAALRSARGLVSPAVFDNLSDLSDAFAEGVAKLELLNRRIKDSLKIADQPESSGR
ncbi:hypothetical protein AgCh_007380 [Apium graveolens]